MRGVVIVAGHVCLDIIPAIPEGAAKIEPGRLVEVGGAQLATGGPVSNTGLSLHKLGVPVRLIGKVGDDLFGQAVRDVFASHGPNLGGSLVVAPGEVTSYSVVISAPGVDRIFLHAPGCNNTFVASDLPEAALEDARIVHFGYPPLMRSIYQRGGRELTLLMSRVKSHGLLTSLDMSLPDPTSEAGKADWRAILAASLPYVDLFMPSADECLFMLDRARYLEIAAERGAAGVSEALRPADFRWLANEALAMGASVVALKAGAQGLYVKTRACAGLGMPGDWPDQERMAPCFRAHVVGTTGSGDATIAGLLMGVAEGWSLDAAMIAATATGACCVEAADSVGGVRPWPEIATRLRGGWARHELAIEEPGWTLDAETQVWRR